MKKAIIFLGFVIILGLCGCGEREKAIHPPLPPKAICDTFTIGVEDGYPLYALRDESGPVIGYDIDLLLEVVKRNQWEIRIQNIVGLYKLAGALL